MSGKNRDAVSEAGAAAVLAHGNVKLAAHTASEPFARKRLREIVDGNGTPERGLLLDITNAQPGKHQQ